MLVKINKKVGIVSYGAYLPSIAVALAEIEKANNKKAGSVSSSLRVQQKTVPNFDEDTATIATEAVRQAIERLEVFAAHFNRKQINTLFIGSESHPYAVKPTGTIVAQALGLNQFLSMADLQFACKAGTQSMQIAAAYVLAGLSTHALAVGADTAQAKPKDALEYTAAAGGASYIFGKKKILAKLLATESFATDTPDFWRRPLQPYPQHGGRFTGQPSYFKHIIASSKKIMLELNLKAPDFDYCIFHTPNGKFPRRVAQKLGFSMKQLKPSLIVEKIGNTYAGAIPLALAAVLDQAQAGEKCLVTAYGSGAGADSFVFEATNYLEAFQKKTKQTVLEQIDKLSLIKHHRYSQLMNLRQH